MHRKVDWLTYLVCLLHNGPCTWQLTPFGVENERMRRLANEGDRTSAYSACRILQCCLRLQHARHGVVPPSLGISRIIVSLQAELRDLFPTPETMS